MANIIDQFRGRNETNWVVVIGNWIILLGMCIVVGLYVVQLPFKMFVWLLEWIAGK